MGRPSEDLRHADREPLKEADGVLRVSNQRARLVVWLLLLNIALGATGVASSGLQVSLLSDISRSCYFELDRSCSFAESRAIVSAADSNDARQEAVAIAQLVLLLLTGVAWLRWQHRAHKDLITYLRSAPLSFSPGWGVGYWFIPLANLWLPFGATRELWTASEPDGNQTRSVPAWLWLWWVTWIAAGILGRVLALSQGGSFQGGTVNMTPSVGTLINDFLWVVAAALAVSVVWGLQRRLVARQAAMGLAVPGGVQGQLPPPPGETPGSGESPAPPSRRPRVVAIVTPVALAAAIGIGTVVAAAPSIPSLALQKKVPIPSISTDPLPSGWTLYSNEADGFSIAAPPQWVEASTSNPDIKLLLENPVTPATVGVTVVAVPASVSPDRFARENVQSLESSPRVHGPIVLDRVTLPAGNALEVSFRFTSSGIEKAAHEYFILKTGAAYGVLFLSLPQDSKGLSATFEEIIKSFRITS